MSLAIGNTSSSLHRPYIGSCRNRNYISNIPSSLLSHDYYFSTIRPSKSFSSRLFKSKNYFSNRLIIDVFEERVPIKYDSILIPRDERQLNYEQKAKGFLPSSLSSSSLFLFPTIAPLTHSDRSPSPFIKEQQQQQLSQPYQSEQAKQCHNHNSFSSSNLFHDTHTVNNESHLLTPTKTHPWILSKISPTNNFPSDLPYQTHVCPLDNMSSLRYSSTSNSKTYSYDQRISDQGNKYIIQLKTDDYQENDFAITPRSDQNQLIIDAKHNEEDSSGGFVRRELHKIFLVPKHIDLIKYTYSYNKNTQELTIEMPYLQSNPSVHSPAQNTSQSLTFSYGDLNLTNGGNLLPPTSSSDSTEINESTINPALTSEASIRNTKPFDFDLFHRSAFRPQIIPTTGNENKLLMSLDLSDYQAEDIKISIKDQELIVKAERKIQTDTRKSRTSFFQSTTLPPQTDIERLQSSFVEGKLIIEAPYLDRRKKLNEQFVTESDKKSANYEPYQQRTETVIEFVRRRRF